MSSNFNCTQQFSRFQLKQHKIEKSVLSLLSMRKWCCALLKIQGLIFGHCREVKISIHYKELQELPERVKWVEAMTSEWQDRDVYE